jgi:hypothetical protein
MTISVVNSTKEENQWQKKQIEKLSAQLEKVLTQLPEEDEKPKRKSGF